MSNPAPVVVARIAKRFTFDAAHFLPGLSPDHPCSRMHGHTYEVELQLVGPTDERGFVVDYADIAQAWRFVHEQIDHRTLNEVPGLDRPTTEVLATWIIAKLAYHPMFRAQNPLPTERRDGRPRECTLLERVIVKESSTTWCEMAVNNVFDIEGVQTRYLSSWLSYANAFTSGVNGWIQWARCGFPADSSGF